MNKLTLTFGIVFGSFGFLISLIFSLFSKNSIPTIIYNLVFSTVISFILGVVVYFILKQRVPEVLEIFNSNLKGNVEYENFDEDFSTEGLDYNESAESQFFSEEEGGSDLGSEQIYEKSSLDENLLQESNRKNEKTKKFGDHILIDKITIKNEPKLMAEAIRTMLARDES